MTATDNKRRIILFISVLVMVISLCACSAPNLSVNQSINKGKQMLTSVENCHLVLQITINPQLVFYLDEAGIVLKTEAGNNDGKSLLRAVELTGLSYEAAVTAVFSTAAKQNLLPENAEIKIDVLASANGPLSLEQTQQLKQAMTDHNAGVVPFVDQSVVVAESCGANQVQVENMENGDVFYSYFSDGERIREICYGADGSYHEWVYENKQTVYTLTVNPDGTRQEQHQSYENGLMVYHSIQNSECLEESTYYSDGTQKSHKTSWTDSSFGEQYFNENGTITYSYESHDGVTMERYYHANGNVKTSLITWPDGSVLEERYDEAGNRIEN